MKRKNVAKRLGIASLCLAISIAGFSGNISFDNNVAAAAETGSIETTDFVYTQAELKQDETGLRISSDDAYKATFKTVFDGDTTFKFKFPETYVDSFYGDFTFRITDAADNSNYFDITYYAVHETQFVTGVYVQYQDEIRMTQHNLSGSWLNTIQTNKTGFQFAPAFLTKNRNDANNNREGILSLVWEDDILIIKANTTGLQKETTLIPIASFDGTYDVGMENNGFVGTNRTICGLPKMNFENGYTVTISSAIDKATDVLFSSIINESETYKFTQKTITMNSKIQAFEQSFTYLTTTKTTAGQVFLGWENTTTNELYPAYSVVRKRAGENYESLVLGFDTVDGASVRVDTSEYSQSGIRFQTTFDVDGYETAKRYIQSFGTLVAWTDILTKGDFTIQNYQGEAAFAQVKNTKGTYEYIDNDGEKYTAYSMAVYVDPDHFTKAYSARGYLVVAYADGSTQTMYTDYNTTDNSRWIAEVAYQYKTNNLNVYNAMTQAQKDVIDAYIAVYVEIMNKL